VVKLWVKLSPGLAGCRSGRRQSAECPGGPPILRKFSREPTATATRRRTAIFSDYPSTFSDPQSAIDHSAFMALPSDDVRLAVTLDKPISVETGDRFALREGSRTIGRGVVTSVR
jgi:elongation factor Tu